METSFTPLASLAGGGLIGLSAVLLMAVAGRIMGATGVLSGALFGDGGGRDWRIALIAGMVSAPVLILLFTGAMPQVQVPVTLPMLLIGGFLVGIGVTFGGGCTSGHGVCGMARLSGRSITATLTFMVATAITVFVIRHMIGA